MKPNNTEEKDVRAHIDKLRKLIEYHRALYYTFDTPSLSDAAYDALVHELAALEKKYPDARAAALLDRVGGAPLEGFQKVAHQHPMLSFQDAFSLEEMHEWESRVEKFLGHAIASSRSRAAFFCELKIDGLAIELIYEEGVLTQASTRGDGKIGEDVTQNIRTITDIPEKLTQLGSYPIPQRLIVRGEIYIGLTELERINKEREEKGLPKYANTRNLAAGSLRQLDPQITASRKLRSFQYDIVDEAASAFTTHEEKHAALASWGCRVSSHTRACADMEEVERYKNKWEQERDALAYEIDGVVVLVNDNATFDAAGTVGKTPRGGIAYKFAAREGVSTVREVQIQVGRTGVLTPVAVLDPVQIGGVTIAHATLHNFDEIERIGLMIGDHVIVTRSGDVIPKIIRTLPELRTGKEKKITLPSRCPVDGSPVVREGVFLRCSNPLCGARSRNELKHFVSRGALDIRGMGEKIIDRFLDEGLISTRADIFSLREGDIADLDRFGEKSARKLIEQIERAKQVSLERFVYALGIPQVGEQTAKTLARLIASKVSDAGKITPEAVLEAMYTTADDEIEALQDVGPIVAQAIRVWFEDKRHKQLMRDFSRAGVVLTWTPPQVGKGIFSNKSVCLTGALEGMPRSRAKELIEAQGGHIVSTVSAKTDILIAGTDPGSKLKEAERLGVEVWDEKKFLEYLRI